MRRPGRKRLRPLGMRRGAAAYNRLAIGWPVSRCCRPARRARQGLISSRRRSIHGDHGRPAQRHSGTRGASKAGRRRPAAASWRSRCRAARAGDDGRGRRSWRRLILWLLLLAAIVGGGGDLFAADRQRAQRGRGGRVTSGGPTPVGIATAQTGDMPVTLSGLGTVTPLAMVTVKTQINGYLMSVGFQEGQHVKKGDFLAQIDPRPYQVALEQAQAQLAKDQATLKERRTRPEALQHPGRAKLDRDADARHANRHCRPGSGADHAGPGRRSTRKSSI